MKKNELRIGNRIGYLIDNCAFEVNELKKETLVLQGVECKYLDCKPIPLTEEWLVKFGFTKHPLNNVFWQRNTTKECFGIFQYGDETFGYSTGGKTFRHVHQLQNLYFALTGEELQIK